MPGIWRFDQCEHDGELLIGVNRDNAANWREPHVHEFAEIVIVADGRGEHVVDGTPYPIRMGNAFVVHGDMVHGYMNGEGLVIEYKRDEDVLILRQDARLAGDDISMTSSEIVFDLGEERLRSSGNDGVEMVLERAR